MTAEEVQRESALPPFQIAEKGPCTWACGCILENEEDKKMNSLLQPPERMQCLQHTDFSQVSELLQPLCLCNLLCSNKT